MTYRLAPCFCPHLKTLCKVNVFGEGWKKTNIVPVSMCYMIYYYKERINEKKYE